MVQHPLVQFGAKKLMVSSVHRQTVKVFRGGRKLQAHICSETLDPERERWLIEQSRQQPAAFRELYRHYLPRVYAYIAYRVSRNQDAEDLTAETFLSMVEHLADFEYRHEGAFAGWVFSIARNQVKLFYRRNHRQPEAISIDDLPDIASDGLLPDDALSQKERFTLLQRLINQLSPRRQEVIRLKYFAGLRNREIAVLLELDERTVASHLSRGLNDLQEHYRAISINEEGNAS